jgi:23S rRNA pseudouridine1911/1915/1917 synthase
MTDSKDGVKYFTNDVPELLSKILNSEDFKLLLKLGAIYVNNERQTKDKIIPDNSSLRVHTKPRRYNCDFAWRDLIVFENDFCLVLNKPSGIPSHPAVDNAIENSLTQVSLSRKYPLFVTHRLDTLTSGLIVYAKKPSFAKSFNIQLQKRSIKKKYVALVGTGENIPQRLTHYMNPAAGTPKKLSTEMTDGWPICELEIVEQKKLSPKLSLVKINLLTGRTHQIRAQLSTVGAPIVGDSLYGSELPFHQNAIALRSCEIEFSCEDERLKFNISEEF